MRVQHEIIEQLVSLVRPPFVASDGDQPHQGGDVEALVEQMLLLWHELFPAEQARIIRLLVERVDLASDGMAVKLQVEGLQTLVEELRSREAQAA